MPAAWNRSNEPVDVGVVVVNRNQGLLLERCMRSALAQTFPGRFHEVVVADAASTDFSREAIASYGNRVVPVLLEPPATQQQAIWEGIKRSSGRYVVCLRAEDFISDYMILFQAIWLYQNSGYDGVCVDYFLVERDSDVKKERINALEKPCPYGTMYRKEVLVREGLYNPAKTKGTGAGIESLFSGKYRIGHIPIPFYRYQKEPVREAVR